MRIFLGGLLIVAFVACATSAKRPEAGPKPVTWAGSMQDLRQSLQHLIPMVFDTKKFYAAENTVDIQMQLKELSTQSKNVQHNPSLPDMDPTVRFVAQSFAKDLENINQAFSEGKKEFARSELMRVTSYCVECHTRTQEGPEFSFGLSNELKALAPVNRLEYLIAFRQFNEAYQLALQELKNSKLPAHEFWQLDRVAKLGLQVAIQFNESLLQAQEIVAAIDANSNLPYYLKQKTSLWKKSLASWQAEKPAAVDLDFARKLLKKDASEIEYMRAISVLLKILSRKPAQEALGESLYLTAKAYENLNQFSLLNLQESYYESCIRQVPHSKWSKKCYENLEESVALGYTGSGGTFIPVEEHVRLQKLKQEAL